jgi:hypothetical protein
MEQTDFQKLVDEYIMTLNEKEYKAYLIAKDHLGDSFQMDKSNGFLEWLKTKISINPNQPL